MIPHDPNSHDMKHSEHNYKYRDIRSEIEKAEKQEILKDPTKRTHGPIKKGKGGKIKKW